ncbi:hypothetical protein D7W82_00340 [Corallococcus sp. CA049B]|uniref:hypothetical protein n=1 Tax=Corallococcus sp. CA049B TaxID=2316730 RepID=UPI000EC9181C|nr:hypothetical protein [Corallococcus sp. CA049B]RKG91541.1 hypothetical protein D7W82_00340 [Corallococcus sp. CA049B]
MSEGAAYWYTTCSRCRGQGRLFIMRELKNGTLYFHCEECEWGWREPAIVGDVTAGFLTLEDEADAKLATREEIEAAGWTPFATYRVEA